MGFPTFHLINKVFLVAHRSLPVPLFNEFPSSCAFLHPPLSPEQFPSDRLSAYSLPPEV